MAIHLRPILTLKRKDKSDITSIKTNQSSNNRMLEFERNAVKTKTNLLTVVCCLLSFGSKLRLQKTNGLDVL